MLDKKTQPNKINGVARSDRISELWNHFKTVHKHEAPTLLCTKCLKRLSVEEKRSYCWVSTYRQKKSGKAVSQLCSTCTEESKSIVPSQEAFKVKENDANIRLSNWRIFIISIIKPLKWFYETRLKYFIVSKEILILEPF